MEQQSWYLIRKLRTRNSLVDSTTARRSLYLVLLNIYKLEPFAVLLQYR